MRQSYRLLSQIMRAAVENDLFAVSPCRGIRLPRMPRTQPHILTEQEVDALVAVSRPPHDLLVMVLAYGGLRINEALALRRVSVDVSGGAIRITESLVEIAGRLSFDTPKNHQHRSVTLPPFVIDRLVEHLASVPDGRRELLFRTARSGQPVQYGAWRSTYFDPAVRAAGLGAARHTTCGQATQPGWPRGTASWPPRPGSAMLTPV